ncbi:MAG: DNA-3-methyladenine glycosylase 2 family protein [Ruminococcaceae bacterium]|nr:DNA-3-methyladenine glycosylase 2 family protein [Oscillospiraceae bacterium]
MNDEEWWGVAEANTLFFEYGAVETDYLKNACPKMAQAIETIGHLRREVTPNLYTSLISSIVAQQISSKALDTVWGRFEQRFDPMTPQRMAKVPVEELQACGISMRKASYIAGITQQVADGSLNLEALHALPDDEVCRQLSALRGIGVWTAEMLMTFSMQRPDVMSYGDLAILRGLRMLHRHRAITPKLFAKYKRRYSPYGSVASLYLWAIASGEYEGYTDPAQKKAAAKR